VPHKTFSNEINFYIHINAFNLHRNDQTAINATLPLEATWTLILDELYNYTQRSSSLGGWNNENWVSDTA
jgi:hypothetical protein